MDENNIRKYAALMQELGLTGLEIKENGCELRLERMDTAAAPVAVTVPVAMPVPETAAPPPEHVPADCIEITSPMVGVFYSAPAENAQPFVSVGDTVKKGDVLCIIEAMKLMNEIVSEYDGVVEEICAVNSQVVDFGHPLFRLRK
ncbi:MAG: acetyl-CoA carboxylase biotin carboxyl carrier protein [Butyricicoccus sp.]|nr:acetyl-CoA carboxylase biotin carboxyl carrier protein [Butyricicoccus sp.]